MQDQAFDRAHRFGQTRDVNIFKLKIDDSVEDRILTVSIVSVVQMRWGDLNARNSCKTRNESLREQR